LDHRGALDLDHRFLDVGVHATQHAGKQVIAEHQGLGGDRLAVVVALMKRDRRFGHPGEELIAGQDRIRSRHSGLLSRPPQ
jgi:hypothetical protein